MQINYTRLLWIPVHQKLYYPIPSIDILKKSVGSICLALLQVMEHPVDCFWLVTHLHCLLEIIITGALIGNDVLDKLNYVHKQQKAFMFLNSQHEPLLTRFLDNLSL